MWSCQPAAGAVIYHQPCTMASRTRINGTLHPTSSANSALGSGSADNCGATLDHRTFSHQRGKCLNARRWPGYPAFWASPGTLLWLQISCAPPYACRSAVAVPTVDIRRRYPTCQNSKAPWSDFNVWKGYISYIVRYLTSSYGIY
jgi:hypothetical protein